MHLMHVDGAYSPEDMGYCGGSRQGLDIAGEGEGTGRRWEDLGWKGRESEKASVSSLSPYPHPGL